MRSCWDASGHGLDSTEPAAIPQVVKARLWSHAPGLLYGAVLAIACSGAPGTSPTNSTGGSPSGGDSPVAVGGHDATGSASSVGGGHAGGAGSGGNSSTGGHAVGGGSGSGGENPSETGGGTQNSSGGTPDTGAGGAVTHPASPRILLLTKTAGFRHTSIPAAIAAVQKLAETAKWEIVATEETALFTPTELGAFQAVMFVSTTGDILNASEEAAFKGFVDGGGGFIGVHAATDTEADWTWYRELLAAHFANHPDVQDAQIHVEQPSHAACTGLPEPWPWHDEWYNFDRNPRANVQVLLSVDEKSYQGGTMGADHPIAWTREVGKARIFYTALGHEDKAYTSATFLGHLKGGISWVLGE